MEKAALISCQLVFYPLGTHDVNKAVEQVLELIQDAPVKSETNALNTIITGSADNIFTLLKTITDSCSKKGILFAMQVGISNNCGCSDSER
jgi:uncharacterized protein YqgV (UPF0045/DUF77 family)